MKKKFTAGILAAALCLSLCGCTSVRKPSDSAPQILLPEPSPEAQRNIFGEQIDTAPQSVDLHYVSGDGSSFSTITRSLIVSPGESIYDEAVDSLLYNAASPERMSFIPPEMQVISTTYASGIVTVNLSLDARNIQNDQEYLMLLASISNTLLSMDGVRGVNVMVDGRSESIVSLPVGTLTSHLSEVMPSYAQYGAERDYFLNAATGTITRKATLFFPTEVGNWFIPELREITFDSSNYASTLIRALREGPSESTCSLSVVPEESDLMIENPQMHITSSGERIVELNFSPSLRNYLAFSGIDEWQLVGSITLTMCTFIPELDAVRICIDGTPITSCRVGETEIRFENGLILRSGFDAFIGSTVNLYLPDEYGRLRSVERAAAPVRAQSPLGLLYILLDDILSDDVSSSVYPDNIYYDDILGISIEDSVAHVNLSANFYRSAQQVSEADERCIIYSMVNTLCGLDEIDSVRFYIEGYGAETLAGSIYLKSALLPNPGIIHTDSPVVATELQ